VLVPQAELLVAPQLGLLGYGLVQLVEVAAAAATTATAVTGVAREQRHDRHQGQGGLDAPGVVFAADALLRHLPHGPEDFLGLLVLPAAREGLVQLVAARQDVFDKPGVRVGLLRKPFLSLAPDLFQHVHRLKAGVERLVRGHHLQGAVRRAAHVEPGQPALRYLPLPQRQFVLLVVSGLEPGQPDTGLVSQIDRLVLLEGGRFPLILRPREDGCVGFIGEAYVQGTMNGELFEEDRCVAMRITWSRVRPPQLNVS